MKSPYIELYYNPKVTGNLTPIYEAGRDNSPQIYIYTGKNSCVPHFHKQIEIIAVHSGTQIIQIGTSQVSIEAGNLAIIDSYEIHAYIDSDAVSTVTILPTQYLNSYKQYKQGLKLKTNFIYDENTFNICLPLIKAIPLTQNLLLRKGQIYTLLGTILDAVGLCKEKINSEYENNLVSNILEYIDFHYAESLTLSSVAKKFNYAASYFSRLFPSLFNCSFSEYLTMVRLQKFLEIHNEKPDYPLSNLIFDSGFMSIPSFYRIFKKNFGVSPQQFIKTDNSYNSNFLTKNRPPPQKSKRL